jgi:signal transduction histidine kinase
LRTPLAVICSAGDNLADSAIADSGTQVRQYGELIRSEGWKLTNMVEQILHVASVQSGRRRYSLRPARVEEITEAALQQVQPLILAAGFTVEKSFEPALPRVSVDAEALSKSIQNLIQNALKYSGGNRWLAVRLGTIRGAHGSMVRLVVEDRGIGIDRADLPYIFDPFYRGRAATDAQIHGTGLGLFVIRKAVAAMGGTISVQSTPGKGSTFTIHLPALPPDEAAGGSETDTASGAKDEPA